MLTLRKEDSRVKGKKIGNKKLIVLTMDNELQELIEDHVDNKIKMLDLYVKFNPLKLFFMPLC